MVLTLYVSMDVLGTLVNQWFVTYVLKFPACPECIQICGTASCVFCALGTLLLLA